MYEGERYPSIKDIPNRCEPKPKTIRTSDREEMKEKIRDYIHAGYRNYQIIEMLGSNITPKVLNTIISRLR